MSAELPALRDAPDVSVDSLWFATSTPAYLEKTNAAAIHAALRLFWLACAVQGVVLALMWLVL